MKKLEMIEQIANGELILKEVSPLVIKEICVYLVSIHKQLVQKKVVCGGCDYCDPEGNEDVG
jgi:hypothetical protein